MTLGGFLILLIISGIAGAIGQAIAGYSTGGCLTSVVVGFVGALIGMWLARALSLPEWFVIQVEGTAFPVVWSIIGAALLVALLSIFTRPSRTVIVSR